MTKAAVAAALFGIAATGVAVPANAAPTRTPVAPQDDPDPGLPTNPSDPRCAGLPGLAQCQGGPYAGPPTGPADLSCISQPADPVCAGGPYSLPPAQPPMAPPPPPPPMPLAPPPMPVAPEPPSDPSIGMPGHI
ncbi:hypothetical protein A5739_16320 [Mycobacterium colombiense]|uniref:hypothetical protein n=1 Tax=Mycobacterium colombiense TaxID=339268 RepID=UPI00097B7873|nr:hypothetical protein [Mycobacterium colombiense]OMB99345.1 hypothetical protein A5732_03440 [Mycobacterium colombiense]OMC29037.1 hypothetical protein A5739_16320 [Mycobacterium colombiense]